MKYTQQTMEEQAALEAAAAMCAAARTAPKAKGVDLLHTMVLTGEDKDALARSLEALGQEQKLDFYLRDAQNLRQAQAVVLIGTQEGAAWAKAAAIATSPAATAALRPAACAPSTPWTWASPWAPPPLLPPIAAWIPASCIPWAKPPSPWIS